MTLRSRRRALAAVTASACGLLVMGVGLTSAAYTDQATANLGTGTAGSGVGNPNRFDIAVRDASNVLQDAATPASAVVLPLTTGAGTSPTFSETTPVVFDATFANRNPGVTGDLTISVYDPDPVATDLYGSLRFTVFLDGSTTAAPGATNLTAAQVNALALGWNGVAPGTEHRVRLSVVLASGTGAAAAGQSTSIGVVVNGVNA